MSGNQKTLGIIGVVCGGVSLFCAIWTSTIIVGIFGILCGVAGIILSNKAKQGFAAAGEQSPLPKIGLILSIIGLALCAVFTISCAIAACVCASATEAALNDPSVASGINSALNEFSSALAK